MEDALVEKDLSLISSWCPPIALFAKKYYNEINDLKCDKNHDFCFIGSNII
jgi:hypothetical protein